MSNCYRGLVKTTKGNAKAKNAVKCSELYKIDYIYVYQSGLAQLSSLKA